MSDDYKKDIKIDLATLDTDWVEHAELQIEWGEKWANAVAKKDRAKENLDVVKAEIDTQIREQYRAKQKPTETAIASMVTTSEAYRSAYKDVIDTNEEVNILQVAKTAFEQARKKALEGLTQLWIAGYYSTPKIPEEAGKEVKERQEKEISKGHKKLLNSNKRLLARQKDSIE